VSALPVVSRDDPWYGYASTVVEIVRPDEGNLTVRPAPPGEVGVWPWATPSPVFVLTAWDPGDERYDVGTNRVRQATLDAELRRRAAHTWAARGADPESGYRDEGVAVVGLDERAALDLGARYGQDAVFAWTPGDWAIVSCDGTRRLSLGWSLGPSRARRAAGGHNVGVPLAARVYGAAHLTGSFVLRSGRKADHYFDKYRFESDPILLRDIVDALVPLVPAGVEGMAGLELGGVPLATMLSSVTGLPAFFVRKEPKKYGTERLCEGGDVAGRRLLIVEDVVTTGGQLVLSAQDLRAEGAVVEDALCVIDREGGGADVAASEGITLHALFTMRALELAASAQR
jgi:orotate phosphoribosyltransferase